MLVTKDANFLIDNVARNRCMLELLSVVLFKQHVVFVCNQYKLVIVQQYHLSEG